MNEEIPSEPIRESSPSPEDLLMTFRAEIAAYRQRELSGELTTVHLIDPDFDVNKLTTEDMILWEMANSPEVSFDQFRLALKNHDEEVKSLLRIIDSGDITDITIKKLQEFEGGLNEEELAVLKAIRDGNIPAGKIGEYRGKLRDITIPKTRIDFAAFLNNKAMSKQLAEYKRQKGQQS